MYLTITDCSLLALTFDIIIPGMLSKLSTYSITISRTNLVPDDQVINFFPVSCRLSRLLLTIFIQTDSSFWFDTLDLGYSFVHI